MGVRYQECGNSMLSGLNMPLILLVLLIAPMHATLTTNYYYSSCPNLQSIVDRAVQSAIDKEPRLAASLLRLHFHDCFVNGCDGSLLLDDTATFTGEKTAQANNNSVRGFDTIDTIKASVERYCSNIVSCADILALVASSSVYHVGGPRWSARLGRRDARTASKADADKFLPGPFMTVDQLTSVFAAVGITRSEMVVLTGAHTIGKAQCGSFRARLYDFQGTGLPDPTINSYFLETLQKNCPQNGDSTVLNNLDPTTNYFDNKYFQNLKFQRGLLRSDQLFYNTTGITQNLVNKYARDQYAWFTDFQAAIIKLGSMSPLEGTSGEIRKTCRSVNA